MLTFLTLPLSSTIRSDKEYSIITIKLYNIINGYVTALFFIYFIYLNNTMI